MYIESKLTVVDNSKEIIVASDKKNLTKEQEEEIIRENSAEHDRATSPRRN